MDESFLKIEILVNQHTGEQVVTIGGMPYTQTSFADKVRAIKEAAKASCGLADFIQRATGDIMPQTHTGHA